MTNLEDDELNESMLAENKCFQELQTQKTLESDHQNENVEIYTSEDVITAFLTNDADLTAETKQEILKLQNEVNSSQSGIHKLTSIETNLIVLVYLLFDWLEYLKSPVINREDFENIVVNYKQAEICFQKFDMEKASLIEYLLLFLTKLQPSVDHLNKILKRLTASLTQQAVVIDDKTFPSEKNFNKLRDGTLNCTMEFFNSLYNIVEQHHSRKKNVKQTLEEDSDVECFQ